MDKFNIDKFKINWIERDRNNDEITSVSGFEYQIDSWLRDYISASGPDFKIKKNAKLLNSDGTQTIIFIKSKRK